MLTIKAVGRATISPISQFLANIEGKSEVQPTIRDTIVNDITVTRVNTVKTITRMDTRRLCCKTINLY